MGPIIAVCIGVYILISIGLGIWTIHRNKDSSEDYFVASRSVGWFHLGLTILATWFSTFSFLGSPGFFFSKGVQWYAVYAFYTGIGVILYWFISRRIWELGKIHGYITPADLLSDFYKSQALRYLVGVVCVLALFPYALIQLVGIGKAVETATNAWISYNTTVLVTAIATAFYVFVGGVRAILWTDVIQGILFSLVIFIGMGISIYAAGGLFEGFRTAVETRPDLFIFKPDQAPEVVSMWLIWSLGFICLPHLWQRSYMAKSASHLTRSMLLVSVMSFVLIFCLMIFGMLGIAYGGAISDTDKFVPEVFSIYLPYALPVLILAAFASGMSTIDSQLLSAASVFVRDLVGPLRGGKVSPKAERRLGKYFTGILVSLLAIFALMPEMQGPIITLASKGTGLAVMMFIPLLGPVFLKNVDKRFALPAFVLGCSYYIFAEFGLIQLSLPWITPIIGGLLINLCVFSLSFIGLRGSWSD